MKTKIGILVLALCTSFFNVQAQRRVVTTTRAASYDISDNLDLDAVASIFGESKDLEDFEYRLNDPDARISNLDLNEDGYIDYLRVLENSGDRNSLVVIQAVLDKDIYQDVATIEIERVQNGNLRVQVIGDSYIYGSNYIIEPVFVRTPVIFSFFWGPHYRPWSSPYYWNYYPRWYSYCRPYPTYRYHKHVHVHINTHNSYHHASTRNIHFSGDNYSRIRRNDYAQRYPDRAFTSRHQGVSNRNELIERRPANQVSRQRSSDVQRSTNRQYQDNRKSAPVRNEGQRNTNEYRRPTYNSGQSRSAQPRTRENSDANTYRKRTESPNRDIQIKSGSRNESTGGRSVTRGQSTSSPNRSANRVESTQRSSTPREKSSSVSESHRGRSNSEAKRSGQSVRKAEPSSKEDKKENENSRRR